MKNRELLKADFPKSIFAVNQGKLHLLSIVIFTQFYQNDTLSMNNEQLTTNSTESEN